MSDQKQLTVIEQREVSFYDDELTAIKAADGSIYVAIRQMCSALGIDDRSQRRRIQNHTVLSDGYQRGVVLTPHRGEQEIGVLRVDLVPLWLSGIRTKSVREEIRAKLERFQREAARVLWEAFKEGGLTADDAFDELVQADTPEARAYAMAKAIYDMARQQLILSNRIQAHGQAIEDNSQRIEAIEARLNDGDRHIDTQQQMDVSQAVKVIALELGKRSRRNEFQGVWGEVYRQFQVTSYLKLPAARFDEVMNFLRQWWESLTDLNNVPFVRPVWSERVSVTGGGHEQHPVIALEFPPN